MKYVALFHANLNYAFLEPHKYEQTIRASYEVIFDTFREKCPGAKYVFEASGFTIDEMAARTPDVLEKLKAAIASGQCEFMGAPYSHPLMANIPEEDGRWSCEFAMASYENHLGFRPVSFWNPECTWMQYVPRAFRDAGVRYLTLDFESYMNSCDKDYSWVERNRTRDMKWGGNLPWYPLDPDCRFLHRPFRDIVPGLHGFCRSDRLVGKYVGYFLGKLPLEEYIANVRHWSGKEGKGATVIIADDAEYCGTSGYYYVKHHNQYDRSFEVDPGAADKLERLVKAVLELGEFATFSEACEIEPVEEPFYVEDRYAWHRTFADVWGNTPEARRFDPVLDALRREYKEMVQPVAEGSRSGEFRELVTKFWFHCTNSADSYGRWPPPPAHTCPFNVGWVENELRLTRETLDLLLEKVRAYPVPPTPPPADTPGGSYGIDYTRKDPGNLGRLNLYELQHALYAAHAARDFPPTRSDGTSRLLAVYSEFERRGLTPTVQPFATETGGSDGRLGEPSPPAG